MKGERLIQVEQKEALEIAGRGRAVFVLVPSSVNAGWGGMQTATLDDLLKGCMFLVKEAHRNKPEYHVNVSGTQTREDITRHLIDSVEQYDEVYKSASEEASKKDEALLVEWSGGVEDSEALGLTTIVNAEDLKVPNDKEPEVFLVDAHDPVPENTKVKIKGHNQRDKKFDKKIKPPVDIPIKKRKWTDEEIAVLGNLRYIKDDKGVRTTYWSLDRLATYFKCESPSVTDGLSLYQLDEAKYDEIVKQFVLPKSPRGNASFKNIKKVGDAAEEETTEDEPQADETAE